MGDQAGQRFRVAVTADAFDAAGTPRFAEMGLEILAQAPGVEHRPLAEHRPVLEARQLEGLQAATNEPDELVRTVGLVSFRVELCRGHYRVEFGIRKAARAATSNSAA